MANGQIKELEKLCNGHIDENLLQFLRENASKLLEAEDVTGQGENIFNEDEYDEEDDEDFENENYDEESQEGSYFNEGIPG